MAGKFLLVALVLGAFVFLGSHAAVGGPDDVRIAVLLSHGMEPYQEVLKGFQKCMD